jgi:putative peptide zinc metalloprotease protein
MTASPSAPAASSPNGPRRADGVVLCGRLRGSGFVASQWLVERDGQYLQLPEPLYRLLEAANGRRSSAELATRLTKRLGLMVRAETVVALVEQRLAPLGLVALPAGRNVSTAAPSSAPPGRAPLALSAKCRMVSPRLIDPCTAVLQVLYWPPLLAFALVAGAWLLRWLFFVHGVRGSLNTALRDPAHLLIVLGLVLLGGAFHELGHAAALRYGGGRVRGMGVGLYLVYPAFYTDVSENYRLGRWARVRTDLGGFYFNLLFSLGIGALYARTGAEYLLLAIVLLVLDILRQSLPFVRMDGYWALADLTGIPDFFATLIPFLRSLVPAARWPGQRLPPLRPWVRGVYAGYLLITLPLLAFALGELLLGLPRLALTAAGTGERLGHQLTAAWQQGAVVLFALTLVQGLLLVLPVAGLALMLVNLSRRCGRLLWRLSAPTPLRRAVGATIALAMAAVLVRLWLPAVQAGMPRQAAPELARLPVGMPGVPAPFAIPLAAQPDAAALAGPPAPQGATNGGEGAGLAGAWLALPADGDPPGAAVTIAGSPARSLMLQPDGRYCVQPLSGPLRCGSYHVLAKTPATVDGTVLSSAGQTLTVLGPDGNLLLLQPVATAVP